MTLNQEQRNAVYSDAKKILCLAGAGTGKTHTMIHRISSLVDDKEISVARILVLTFTNAAAAEMEGRYRKDHSSTMAPKFATFHSFCYSLIAEQPAVMKALGYSKIPELLDDENRKLIDKTIRQTLNIKIGEKKLKGHGALSPQEQFEYDLYWKSFKKELFKRNLITFDIMCNDVCDLFVRGSPAVESIKNRYKYIMVNLSARL